jgi:hypothetical protein
MISSRAYFQQLNNDLRVCIICYPRWGYSHWIRRLNNSEISLYVDWWWTNISMSEEKYKLHFQSSYTHSPLLRVNTDIVYLANSLNKHDSSLIVL